MKGVGGTDLYYGLICNINDESRSMKSEKKEGTVYIPWVGIDMCGLYSGGVKFKKGILLEKCRAPVLVYKPSTETFTWELPTRN